jgi:uncharacterized damage-inducible protein DinB
MDLTDVKTLLDYNYWARDIMLEAVSPLTPEQLKQPIESSFKSVHATIVHIYGAECIWFARWRGEPATMPQPERFATLAAIRTEWTDIEGRIRVFVDELGDAGMNRIFNYVSLAGQPASSPFWQMLQHVVNHGSYHRGQVTTMLRQLGAKPPKQMDLIAYYRTMAAAR